MATVTAIQGVDDTLKKIATDAVAGLTPKPTVTVGPLDRDDDELRLNWFLYRIGPNPAYRNMEPPKTGWRTSRGRPPLALQLSYLLTAFPASAQNSTGDQEQFAHAGLAAAMRALHGNAIVGDGDPALSPLAAPLVEPLRITLETLDLEALTKLWTAATRPIRLSVGYEVSLVSIDSPETFAPGPPVQTRRVAVTPSLGPRLISVDPARITHGVDARVIATGLTAGVSFLLARAPGDPPGPAEGWAMTVVPNPPPGTVVLRLPRDDLAPGARRLDAVATAEGLPAGRDSIAIMVVPTVLGPPGPIAKGTPVALATAHVAPDVEVFVGGTALPASAVSFVSATQVDVTLPSSTPSGPTQIGLRANKVAGPLVEVTLS
jgi:hypothetical protein